MLMIYIYIRSLTFIIKIFHRHKDMLFLEYYLDFHELRLKIYKLLKYILQ